MIRAKVNLYRHPRSQHPSLHSIDITLPSGAVTCLLGLSGAGKTTLVRILMGLASGHFDGTTNFYDGGRTLTPQQARKLGLVGVLAQGSVLVPWLTVRENLLLPSKVNTLLAPPSNASVSAMIESLNLSQLVLSHYPDMLSFGMSQRLALARALLYEPRFLLLDEVFTGLDSFNADELAGVLQQYVRSAHATCLVVTHDILRASALGQSFLYLSQTGTCMQLTPPITESMLLQLMRDDAAALSSRLSSPNMSAATLLRHKDKS